MTTHLCPIAAGAGGLIDKRWCIDHFAETLAALPEDLSEAEVLRPELRLWVEGRLSIYYVPFERVNPTAKIMLVGLTPGRRQMWLATMAAARILRQDGSIRDAVDAAWASGSFGGPMRSNLVQMLDGIGIAESLGISSAAQMWTPDAAYLEAGTSALLHPVFVADANYSGGNPKIADVPILSAYVDQVLAAALTMTPEALIVPLGKAVSAAVESLVVAGKVDKRRVLIGFPHPSGANGHRKRLYDECRKDLAAQVERWAA